MKVILIFRFHMQRQTSVSSADDEDDDDSNLNFGNTTDNRKEAQSKGAIKFETYKAFLNAANSKIFVIFVFVLFIVAQVTWSGTDYFLSEWFVSFEIFYFSLKTNSI